MNYVADMLEMPRMRVYEVTTFYTMFNRLVVLNTSLLNKKYCMLSFLWASPFYYGAVIWEGVNNISKIQLMVINTVFWLVELLLGYML